MTEEMSLTISVLSIIVAVIAIIVSIKAWHKSRAVYGVEREVLRQFDGSRNDLDIIENEKLNEKLSSGNYTILSVMERTKGDNDWEVLLGRITPYNKMVK